MSRIAARESDSAVRGHRKLPPGIRAIQLATAQAGSNRLHVAVESQASDLHYRLVDVLDVKATTVGGPHEVFHRTVESIGNRVRILPVAVHDIHANVLITELTIVEA